MSRRLFDTENDSLFSPLIDVVMGALGAFFTLLVVYMMLFQQSLSAEPEPLRFLPMIELSGATQASASRVSSYRLPPIVQGQNYLFTFPVTGGSGKRTFELTGELPTGLAFDKDSGTLYGLLSIDKEDIPSSFSFAIAVNDNSEHKETTATLPVFPVAIPYSRDKTPLTLTITQPSLKNGRINLPYEEVLGATGGIEPYLWEITSGELPTGLALKDGYIQGLPEQAGIYTFTVQVRHTPGRYRFDQQLYTWEAEAIERPYQIEILESLQHTLTMPIGRANEPFIGGLTTNGMLDNEYVVWSGNIPGIQVSADRALLSGIPSKSGDYPISYEIQHNATVIGEGSNIVTILPERPLPKIGPAIFQAWVGESVQLVIPYRGLIEPIQQISISSGELPEALRISGGEIVGTPTETGLFTIAVTVTDSTGKTYDGEIIIRVGERF